jgi:hypothetical protein
MPLKRALYPMPSFVRAALKAEGLMEEYRARPPYQRNDYLRWIANPKREDTRQRRLAQMLDELRRGNVYMQMTWNAKAARQRASAPARRKRKAAPARRKAQRRS